MSTKLVKKLGRNKKCCNIIIEIGMNKLVVDRNVDDIEARLLIERYAVHSVSPITLAIRQ